MDLRRAEQRKMSVRLGFQPEQEDGWVERANNAAFAIQAAYDDLVPAFERLFEREGRDFARFYAEVRRFAALPKAERHATLRAP